MGAGNHPHARHRKILLGSDMPWSATGHEIRFVKSLSLLPEETDAILGGNACRLLHVT